MFDLSLLVYHIDYHLWKNISKYVLISSPSFRTFSDRKRKQIESDPDISVLFLHRALIWFGASKKFFSRNSHVEWRKGERVREMLLDESIIELFIRRGRSKRLMCAYVSIWSTRRRQHRLDRHALRHYFAINNDWLRISFSSHHLADRIWLIREQHPFLIDSLIYKDCRASARFISTDTSRPWKLIWLTKRMTNEMTNLSSLSIRINLNRDALEKRRIDPKTLCSWSSSFPLFFSRWIVRFVGRCFLLGLNLPSERWEEESVDLKKAFQHFISRSHSRDSDLFEHSTFFKRW